MYFIDLSVGDSFTVSQFPDKIFIKDKFTKATCCTPNFNAYYTGKHIGDVILFEDDQEVTLVKIGERVKQEEKVDRYPSQKTPRNKKSFGPGKRGGGRHES